jgi:hypothetical protein
MPPTNKKALELQEKLDTARKKALELAEQHKIQVEDLDLPVHRTVRDFYILKEVSRT